MSQKITIISPNKNSSATINKGELINYIKNNEELIHQKNEPGWRSSDTEMFPIIGPTIKNNYEISTPKGKCFQEQHGLSRELEYIKTKETQNSTEFTKIYKKNTQIKNSKYPTNSTQEFVSWPYNFKITKTFELNNKSLIIKFNIETEKEMPYMFGYHPAFKLSGNNSEYLQTKNKNITILNILDKGHNAYPILNCKEINLIKQNKQNIKIQTQGFNNIMMWTMVSNMLCIEPITQYPELINQKYSEKNMRISSGKETFSIEITPYN